MLTEKGHAFGFLITEGDGHMSRDTAILVSGQNLQAGAILMASGSVLSPGHQVYTEVPAGSETSAIAILGAACDATSANTACVVIARAAEVNGHELAWIAGSPTVDQAAVAKALAAAPQIIVRF